MFQSEIFDEVADGFGRPFTEAEILAALSMRADWTQTASYCHSLLLDRVAKTKLNYNGTHYSVNPAYIPTRRVRAAAAGAAGPIAGVPATWAYDEKNGYRIPFSLLPLSSAEALKFCVHTVRYYLRLIDEHSRTNLKPGISLAGTSLYKLYLAPTDKLFLDPLGTLPADSFVFKEMVFHTQNRQGGIPFLAKEASIDTYLLHYDIPAFYRYISTKTSGGEVPVIQAALEVTEDQAEDFFKSVKSIAIYLNRKLSGLTPGTTLKASVIGDFSGFMPTFNYKGIYNAMKNPPISISGLGEALTFDFLKELDPVFNLPKPDLHVKRTMISLLHEDRASMALLAGCPSRINPESIRTIHGRTSGMRLYLDLMNSINSEFDRVARRMGKHPRAINNYVLDKMIYMVCSGKLYLQVSDRISKKNIKNGYRAEILRDAYKSIHIEEEDIDNILSLI